jgi:BlaI family penicillinase repressor
VVKMKKTEGGAADSVLHLSRRERQIMDAVYRRGEAAADEITADIPYPPTQDAVRRLIRILEEKGYLRHRKDGARHVYSPTVGGKEARTLALRHLIKTHFRGSASQAVAALLEAGPDHLSKSDRDEIMVMIEKARKEGR